MAPSKRKSDPLPLRTVRVSKKPTSVSLEDDSFGDPVTSTSGSGEELEKLIGVIHNNFKRKNRENQLKAEQTIQTAIDSAMKDISEQVATYQSDFKDKFDYLKASLSQIEQEREEQVGLFKTKYRQLKSEVKSIIKYLERYETKYGEIAGHFFAEAEALNGKLGALSSQEEQSTALVPHAARPSSRGMKRPDGLRG